jgi:phage baseplate assembly protein W
MPELFLGTGWAFPVSAGQGGGIAEAAHDASVRQAIWIILGTAKGERVMRPDFGCGIHELVFERNTPTTAGKVSEAVRDALVSWEPRIDLLDVKVEAQAGGSVLQISVDFQVRATNNAFNLVFPFYLQQGDRL